MKIKDTFVLRKVAESWVVLPLGQSSLDFNGMLTLNNSAAFLWGVLEQGSTREGLVDALMAEYEVDQERASADVDAFLDVLSQVDCLED